jgi:hypothetical protein
MFDAYGQYQASTLAPSGGNPRIDPGVGAIGRAVTVFHNLAWRAQLKRLFGKLVGRSYRLLDLADVRANETIESMHEAGCQTVEVRKIRGSECRVSDFDSAFLPMRQSTGQRWAGIYAARLCGQTLPAVSLVQVGDTYYVRDGHHRISVARLLGEEYIEANVQVWQVRGQAVSAPAMSGALLAVI